MPKLRINLVPRESTWYFLKAWIEDGVGGGGLTFAGPCFAETVGEEEVEENEHEDCHGCSGGGDVVSIDVLADLRGVQATPKNAEQPWLVIIANGADIIYNRRAF